MPTVFDPFQLNMALSAVLTASHASPPTLERWRRERLAHVWAAARQGSTLYRQRLGLRAGQPEDLIHIPPVTRAELMADFAGWVTDPRLQLAELQAFTADPARVGEVFLGQYLVWESSGTSGSPGIFVQDARCMAVYDALESQRPPARPSWQRMFDPLGLTERVAFVGATAGHFASLVAFERLRAVQPWRAGAVRSFSILQPVGDLLAQLRDFAPNMLATYPTAAALLAEEARQGRFRPALREVWTGGETLTLAMRQHIERHLKAPLRHSYGTSEFLPMGWECSQGHMHLNTDWLWLEPVDEHFRPVPPGQPSDAVLLTSLVNTVQPLIRCVLGDHLTLHSRPCSCGSPLPVVDVQGRCDDVLVLRGAKGSQVSLLPLAVSTVLEVQAGLFDFQVRQLDDHTLVLCLPGTGEEVESALARGCQVLRAFATQQGATTLRVNGESGHDTPRGRSGKCCRIMPLRG